MKIGILPFDRVHQQAKNTGSSRIRGYWLTKHYYTDRQVLDDGVGVYGHYDPETINENLKKHDFIIAPRDITNPRAMYKSNNREVSSWCLGLPCATKKEDIMRFIDGKERIKEMEARSKELVDKWDIKYYVDEYKKFLQGVWVNKTNKK